MARPSDFTQALADLICEKIADGQSLRRICLADEMPDKATVFKWLAADNQFRDQYARAREAQADALAEECLEISDDGSNDWVSTNDPENPGYRLNGEHVQRSRLRVDARKWFAGKVAPKKYGDKIQQEHSGPDGGPVISRIECVIVDPANPRS